VRWIPTARGLPSAFWLIWIGTVVNRAGGFVSPFLTLYLTGERRLPVAEAGAMVGLVGLGALGAGPVGGGLADRLGRRPAMAIATTSGAMAMMVLGLARSETTLAVGATLVGFCGEMYRAPSTAMVADLVKPEDRTRAYGLLYWAANIGFAIAPAVAGLVATRSYCALFIGDAATTLAFGAIVVLGVHETRQPHPATTTTLRALLSPYARPRFLAFCLVHLLIAVLFNQIGSSLPVDMIAHGVPAARFGTLIALNGVLITLFQPFVTSWTHRLPRARVLASAAVVIGLGLGINDLAQGSAAIYALSIAVWTSGEIAMSGLSPAIVADFAPAHLRATYQGAFQFSFGAAYFIGPVAGTAMLGHYGSSTLWHACVAVGLVAAVGYLVVVPRMAAGSEVVPAGA
jgi:MFS family permease